MNIYEIVKKLVGPIHPIGESNTDNDRFENLKVMTELIDQLLANVDDVAYNYENSHQDSMKRASALAIKFQNNMKILDF